MLESVFQGSSDFVGLPLDQVRYIAFLFLCYPLAFVFRHILHPSHTPLSTRHTFSAVTGLSLATICFDWQVLVVVAVVGVSYILLLTVPPEVVQRYTMVWVMGCLSVAHLYRTLTDYGGYHLDITGPLMILVQKLSLVSYAVHDGMGNPQPLNDDQKKQKLSSVPSVLEYMSYCFNFHSVLAGPSVTMREHLAFMDGSNFSAADSTGNGQHTIDIHGKELPKEPSSLYPVVSKLVLSLTAGVLHIFLSDYNSSVLIDPTYNILHRLFYSYLVIIYIRCRYYFVWILSDSISNAAGLGFEGYDRLNQAKWGLATNIYVVDMELSMNIRTSINSWNVTSARWLRRVCYERVTWNPTLQTFVLSSLWHGFYPGYYCCFIGYSVSLQAAKKIRRVCNPFFTSHGLVVKWCYHLITWVITQFYVNYVTLPFVLMWLPDVWIFWKYHYFIPSLAVVMVLLFLPSSGSQKSRGGGRGEGKSASIATEDAVKSEKQD